MTFMFRFFVIIVTFLVTVASCSRAVTVDEEPNDTVVFSRESGTFSGTALPYRKAEICTSEVSDDKSISLVVYLHGGTSKGSDNTTQMAEPAIDSISTYLLSNKVASVFLVPQCSSDKSWGGDMNTVLKALIGKYAFGKVYILGGSMGETGTWSMVSSYPGFFAGAMPVAGNPSRCDASNVVLTPVITVMGTADNIMDSDKVEEFVSKVQTLGGVASFSLEEGWTHEDTCIRSYTQERLSKLFSY